MAQFFIFVLLLAKSAELLAIIADFPILQKQKRLQTPLLAALPDYGFFEDLEPHFIFSVPFSVNADTTVVYTGCEEFTFNGSQLISAKVYLYARGAAHRFALAVCDFHSGIYKGLCTVYHNCSSSRTAHMCRISETAHVRFAPQVLLGCRGMPRHYKRHCSLHSRYSDYRIAISPYCKIT